MGAGSRMSGIISQGVWNGLEQDPMMRLVAVGARTGWRFVGISDSSRTEGSAIQGEETVFADVSRMRIGCRHSEIALHHPRIVPCANPGHTRFAPPVYFSSSGGKGWCINHINGIESRGKG